MCVCACVCVCAYMCMCVHMCIHEHLCVCVCAYMCICVHVCIHKHLCVCVCACACTCVYICVLLGLEFKLLHIFSTGSTTELHPSHQLFTHPNGGLPNANAFQTRSRSNISCPVLPSSPLFLHLRKMTAYSCNHSWLKCRCDVDPSLSPKPSLIGSELPHLPRFLHCSNPSHFL